MESNRTLADDAPQHAITTVRVGPYLVSGRLAVYSGVEVLAATHEISRVRAVLRRLLPLGRLSDEEASHRLQAFQEEARRRGVLQDPRHLRLFDFARTPDGGAYQVFTLPDGFRSIPRDPKALPLEEWVQIAAEAGAALESLLHAGITPGRFDPSGLAVGPNGEIRLTPLDFPWPPYAPDPVETARTLAEWLYRTLAGVPLPPVGAPASLCHLNPRVSPELDMSIRAALNPYAVNVVSSPGEFARLLRDKDSQQASSAGGRRAAQTTSNLWANIGAWAVLLALGGVTLGWLLALYLPRR